MTLLNYHEPLLPEPEKVKHISFDIRSTLLLANQEFKKKRIQFFYENCNPNSLSLEAVTKVFKDVDEEVDAVCEWIGASYQSDWLYGHVLFRLGYKFDTQVINNLYKEVEEIIAQNLPTHCHEETVNSLESLHNMGYTINALSNTGFIKWETLKKILEKTNIAPFISFEKFSDQVGYSKPDMHTFDAVYQEANIVHNKNLTKKEVLHIGDNFRADIQGAQRYGFQAYRINNKSGKTILDLVAILGNKI